MIEWAKEWPPIRDAAIEFGVDPYFIAAIRVAEDGPDGCEFGVKSEPAPTYADQLRIACISVRNHFGISVMLWNRRAYPAQIVQEFALRWAPPQSSPLNANWFKNCWGAYAKFCESRKVE